MSECQKRTNNIVAFAAVCLMILAFVAALSYLLPVDIVKAVIEHASWPIFAGICIVIFRDNVMKVLTELPGLVSRSSLGNGSGPFLPKQEGMKRVGGYNELGDKSFTNHENGDIQKGQQVRSGAASFCERQWIERLQKEYGVPVLERRSIGVSTYYFDAVMEYGKCLYGIEICNTIGHCNWERVFDNVQKAYDGLVPELKKRFIFMVCVVSAEDDECAALRAITKKHDFTTVIKHY